MKNKNEKITIISLFYKHEDFIKIQYNSLVKHVKCDFEYIIFNNGSSEEQFLKNKKYCDELCIKSIKINTQQTSDPSINASSALTEAFKHLDDKLVFKIDSDMFFVQNIDLEYYLNNFDLIYVPNRFNEIMWSGIFGINRKKVKENLDFYPKPGGDTFCMSENLVKNKSYSKKTIELFNIERVQENGKIETNYNTDCRVIFNEKGDVEFCEKQHYLEEGKIDVAYKRYKKYIENLNKYNFPKPYNVDFISFDSIDCIFHFKSSNWAYNSLDEHIKNKKKSTKEMLKDKI